MGAPGPPDIVGLSKEIIGFPNRGGGPVGHPQGVQVDTLILNRKSFPKGHHAYIKTLKSGFSFGRFWVGFGQSWARDRYQRPRLETRSKNRLSFIRETETKATKLKPIKPNFVLI